MTGSFIFEYKTPVSRELPIADGEEWRVHPDHPGYQISSHGRVWSEKTRRIRKFTPRDDGYQRIRLSHERGYRYVHRLVAEVFLGPRPSADHELDHIDRDRGNNRADNLRWVTRSENIVNSGADARPVDRYTPEGEYVDSFESVGVAAVELDLNKSAIYGATKTSGTDGANVTIGGFVWRWKGEVPDPVLIERATKLARVRRRICRYTLRGELVDTFEDSKSAASAVGLARNTIQIHVKGGTATAGGYIWRYEGEEPPTPADGKPTYARYTKEGVLDRWSTTLKDLGEDLGRTRLSHAVAVMAGKRKTAYGFRWAKYEPGTEPLQRLE